MLNKLESKKTTHKSINTSNEFLSVLWSYKFHKWYEFFKYYKQLLALMKKLDKYKFDFDFLWECADFIKFAETIFQYPNKLKWDIIPKDIIGLYSSQIYETDTTNGFKMNMNIDTAQNITTQRVATIKLSRAHHKYVALEIVEYEFYEPVSVMKDLPKKYDKKVIAFYEFQNGEWITRRYPSDGEELLLATLYERMKLLFKVLFDWCKGKLIR